MSDLSVTLPNFEGTDIEVEREQLGTVSVFTAASGREQRVARGPLRRRFTVTYNFLRDFAYLTTGSFSGSSEVNALVSLHAMATGSLKTFEMQDPFSTGTVEVRFEDEGLTITREAQGVYSAECTFLEVLP